MITAHGYEITLKHSFRKIYGWLLPKESIQLITAAGTEFVATVFITTRGKHAGERALRFFQGGKEYARAYECCWGYYYNCNRTRMGMYCQALDQALSKEISSK